MTALLWKDTTKLGCGVAGIYVVCHYCDVTPNMMGQFEQQVLRKKITDSSIKEKCTEKQIRKADGVGCDYCPRGLKPNASQTECVIDCKKNQIIQANECVDCPQYQTASEDQATC